VSHAHPAKKKWRRERHRNGTLTVNEEQPRRPNVGEWGERIGKTRRGTNTSRRKYIETLKSKKRVKKTKNKGNKRKKTVRKDDGTRKGN